MKVINYNNEAQFNALQQRIHNRLQGKKKELKYNAQKYCLPKKRIDGTVDFIIDDEKHPAIYAEILADITPNEVNNLEDYNPNNYLIIE